MQFMKHVFPRLISPRRPGHKSPESRSYLCAEPQVSLDPSGFLYLYILIFSYSFKKPENDEISHSASFYATFT